eukprot:1830115-Pyramimonas_sp.AAC.1
MCVCVSSEGRPMQAAAYHMSASPDPLSAMCVCVCVSEGRPTQAAAYHMSTPPDHLAGEGQHSEHHVRARVVLRQRGRGGGQELSLIHI